MALLNVEELYEKYVKPLSAGERRRLILLTAQDLYPDSLEKPRTRSILELHGLGADVWEGIDAQQYVNELRDEWDHRP